MSPTDHSVGFRWTVRAIALAGLFAIAYQLAGGDLCTFRHQKTVCIAGPPAFLAALGFAFICFGIAAFTFSRGGASTMQKVCWVFAGVSFISAVVVHSLS